MSRGVREKEVMKSKEEEVKSNMATDMMRFKRESRSHQLSGEFTKWKDRHQCSLH